ncbi:hypothetical protein EMPG_13328 [Blastomyces silverae]|uniref:Uncharacterized protein n=1 Tax=Blastomyces silverae TaxID=2060906 RepID=A0A0H1BK35_9EURO|nr:hypothetical protein EMPG_13328 [Blastomyces silverae]
MSTQYPASRGRKKMLQNAVDWAELPCFKMLLQDRNRLLFLGRLSSLPQVLISTRLQQQAGPGVVIFSHDCQKLPQAHPLSPRRWELKKKWYQQLKALLADLEENSRQAILGEEDQQRLGIRFTRFSGDPEEDSNSDPQFFTPLRRGNLPVSPCDRSLYHPDDNDAHLSLWPREPHVLDDDYLDGRQLADSITRHLSKITERRPSAWWETGPIEPRRRGVRWCDKLGLEHYFIVEYIYDLFMKRKPHQILVMVSDHPPAQEDSLIRSEVLAMASFMRWKMNSMEREQSLVYPVLVIGILNRFKLHILQGHFDGCLNVRQSKIYDFQVADHEEIMKLVICWLMSTPHGDTTLSMDMPLVGSCDDTDDDDDDANTTEVTTPSA